MQIDKRLLKPNIYSSKIYDEFSFLNEDDQQLISDISDNGEILNPLIITTDNVVISGVRRLSAIQYLSNIQLVPVIISEYHSSDLNEAIVIRYNIQRRKTIAEIAREYETITRFYKLKSGVNPNDPNIILGKKERLELIKSQSNVQSSEKTIQRVLSSKKMRMSLFGESEPEAWENLSKEISKGIEPNTIYTNLKKTIESRANEIKIASTLLLETESIRIINKDSSDLSDEVSDESVDCIPTSPPYFLKVRTYDADLVNEGNSLGEEETMEEFIDNRMKILRECKRMIKDTGSIFINIMDQRKNGRILRVDSKLCDAFEDEGMVLVNRMIWFKNNPLYESNNGFQKSMEYILHFVKDPKKYKWRTDWLDSTSTFLGNITFGDVGTKRKIRDVVSYDFPDENQSAYVSGKLNTNTINNNFLIKILREKGYYLSHNALFPLEVPLICVMSTTDPGDLVLDVWGGLSTTGLIAYANNCRYIGVDQSLEYSAMASVRIKDFIERYSPIERVSG